jgi:hypothetical protein
MSPVYSTIIALIICGIPFIICLDGDKKVKKDIKARLGSMWQALTNHAVWQVLLFSLVFGSINRIQAIRVFAVRVTPIFANKKCALNN